MIRERPSLARVSLGWALALALASGCYSRERAPEAAPASPAPVEAQQPQSEEEASEPRPAPAGEPPPPPATLDRGPESGGAAPPARAPRPTSAPRDDAAKSKSERDTELEPEEAKRARRQRGVSLPESLMNELSREVSLGAPDCPSARERKKTICDLASQICRLVERDPNVASVERYCSDAKQRCSEAEGRTLERCGD